LGGWCKIDCSIVDLVWVDGAWVSLQPRPWPEVPEMTVRVARAAFPKGCMAIRVRDELGPLFSDEEFASAFGVRGRPGYSPGQLALISVLQFVEGLTDRQAADAVRGRIDWKYCLGLDLDDPGFGHTVLTGFRARLIEHGLQEKVLDLLLARLVDAGLVKAGGRARTDSTHVLAAVRTLNRIEFVGEMLRAALEALATVAPGWLAGAVPVEWVNQYGARVDSYRMPKGEADRAELAVTIGRDGFHLLEAVLSPEALAWLCQIPASSPPPRSTSSGLTPGGPAHPWEAPEPPTSRPSTSSWQRDRKKQLESYRARNVRMVAAGTG
jgi:transposase